MRKALLLAIEKGGLTSVMNSTIWRELRDAVARELPFAPAFQRKDVLSSDLHPETFDEDVWHCGDWPAGTDRCAEIEWIRVRPRKLVHRGRLISEGVDDIEEQFVELLSRLKIPFVLDSGVVTIFGYSSNPGTLTTRA